MSRPSPQLKQLPGSQIDSALSLAIIEDAEDAIIAKNLDGTVIAWNSGATRIFGYTAAEMIGGPLTRLFPADRLHEEAELIAKLAHGNKISHFVTRRLRKNGPPIDVSVTLSPVRDVSGKIVAISKIARDITEAYPRQLASALAAAIVEHSDDAIISKTLDGTVTSWNLGAQQLFGYTASEMIGAPIIRLFPDDRLKEEPELISQVMMGKSTGPLLTRRIHKDGTSIDISVTLSPVRDAHGQIVAVSKIAREVNSTESLRRATKEAERANSAKSLFLANMSHEIRTPMNAVIGLTYLLEQTALNSEQMGLVAQISGASKLLLAVITDVLDLSKIEAGELMISRVAFSPRELLKGLHAIMREQADLKGITLHLDVPDDLPAVLEGDAARLNQILTNLLSNAIKFTERGGVTLCVRLLGSTSAGSTLSFTVRDTGIGIDSAAQARLFTPFIQADESITRRYGGTGLGLSIINSLAKLMDGTVDFTSTVGVGSEFRVVLEFALATAESLAAMQPVPVVRGERPISGVRVLVVDDYHLNLVVTQRILEQAGALVRVAHNGQDAYEKLKLQHFDIVLMDVQMPIMDGYEATRRIRTDLGLLDLPIIALTAGALVSERQRATAVGMDDFIIKPFDAATLISSVMHHTVSARVPAGEIPSAQQMANGWVVWPEMAGIDIKDARNRFCDDPALFRSSLQRFLGDISDIGIPSSRSAPPSLAEQAGRLHKLKGGAGLLGAKAIQHLAAEAEAACVAGDGAIAGERLIELGRHLDALRSSAARGFESARTGGAPTAALTNVRLEPHAVATREQIDAPSWKPRREDAEGRCRVLLVDDDDLVRAHVVNLLERSGYRVGEAASGEEALRALRGGDYSIVITDWQMPGMSGIELCRELRVGIENRDLYVVMLTASDCQEDVELSRAAGADAYVLKSAPNSEILARMAAGRPIVRLRSSARETVNV